MYVDQAPPFCLHSAPILVTVVVDAIGWGIYEGRYHSPVALPRQFSFLPAPLAGSGTLLQTRLGHASRLGHTSSDE